MAEVTIKITVTGLDQLSTFLKDTAPDAITQGFNDALSDLRTKIENTTTGLCPVRTGALKASIDIQQQGDFSLSAKAGMDYASFVDEGTTRQRAQPFFTDPITREVDQFKDDIERKITDALQRAGG